MDKYYGSETMMILMNNLVSSIDSKHRILLFAGIFHFIKRTIGKIVNQPNYIHKQNPYLDLTVELRTIIRAY